MIEAAATSSSSSLSEVLSSNQTAIILTTVVVALYGYHYYANVYSYFRKRGLRGPTPLPIVGNMLTILLADKMVLERDWTRRYGKFYGIFMGSEPTYVVNDPDVLQQICIKDFDAMPNHEYPATLNEYQKQFIFFAQDDYWKRLRVLHSPTFTSGRIKRMYKLIDQCVDDLVLNFSEHLKKGDRELKRPTVNMREVFPLFSLDAISSAAFTIKLDRKSTTKPKSLRADFLTMVQRLFEIRYERLLLALIFPEWLQKLAGLEMSPRHYFTDLEAILKPLIEQRKKGVKKADDYLQILVDARLEESVELDEMDDKENHHASITKASLSGDQQRLIKDIEKSSEAFGQNSAGPLASGTDWSKTSRARLTDMEIVSSAMVMIAVGVETTATLLCNCAYALAFHLDVQENLYQAVKSMARVDSETGTFSFDYNDLTSCEYLDAVISETLRFFGIAVRIERSVGRDYHLEKYDVHLKRGAKVQLALYSIMNNAEYWPEPLRFNPDRFIGENKRKIVPGSYCPFGLGPRHCLGMRFSLTESKLAMAKILMNFRLTSAPGTKFPPTGEKGLGFNNITTPFVEITARA